MEHQTLCAFQEEKIRLLKDKASQIRTLQAQLEHLQAEYRRLERDISPCQMVVLEEDISPQATPVPAVHKCPNEILLLIFEHYIAERHRNVRCLLFVCKRWNALTMQTPRLWARLQITEVEDVVELSYTHRSLLAYISACKRRSCGLPLDVELDLYDLPTRGVYVFSEMMSFAQNLVDEEAHAAIESQIFDIDWDHKCSYYERKINGLLHSIFGAKGAAMDQWATLSLVLPDDDELALRVWKRMTGASPNLKSVSITMSPAWNLDIDSFDTKDGPNFSSVEHLDCKRCLDCIPLRFFHLSPEKVTHLEITFSQTLSDFPYLVNFTRLRKLGLFGRRSRYPELLPISPIDKLGRIPFRMPNLRELAIGGEYELLDIVDFDLPELDQFILISNEVLQEIPALKTRRLCWRPHHGHGEKKDPASIFDALVRFLRSRVTAQYWVIPRQIHELVLRFAAPFPFDDRYTASALPRIAVEHEDGRYQLLEREEIAELFGFPGSARYSRFLVQQEEEATHRAIAFSL